MSRTLPTGLSMRWPLAASEERRDPDGTSGWHEGHYLISAQPCRGAIGGATTVAITALFTTLVLRSFVFSSRDRQRPLLIALAGIGGTCAFGVPGILLGSQLVSLAAALLKAIQR